MSRKDCWNIGFPPQDTLVALVVRKWVAHHDGFSASFIARDPAKHFSVLGEGFASLQFDPAQTVCMGRVVLDECGKPIVLNEEGGPAGFEMDAILAWAHVPSFAMDQAAAKVADLLLKRVAHAHR